MDTIRTRPHTFNKLNKPVYPFQTAHIEYDGAAVELKDTLRADVRFDKDEKLYYISYPDLDLTVWGSNRQEAEEAFQFTFLQLVKNIYNEVDERLTKKALTLKEKLGKIISQSLK